MDAALAGRRIAIGHPGPEEESSWDVRDKFRVYFISTTYTTPKVPVGALPIRNSASMFSAEYPMHLDELPKTLDDSYERIL